jgi:gamma-glutamyltranspeptidase/glutathione hydrolase
MKKRMIWLLFGFGIVIFSSYYYEKDNYLITASMSKIGVNAGMHILDEGGTAMDAALSIALSEIAETGGKYISYAGIMDLVYYESKTGKIYNMNASFNTIQNETNPLTIPGVTYNMQDTFQNTVDGRTILVPGFMKGLEESHKKFGKLPFHRLFENAIKIAEEGTEWTSEDNSNFLRWKNILTKYPETKAVFTKPDGSFYQTGEMFKQPELAKTLRKISIEGADYMYKGEWAKKFVNTAKSAGSKITLKDLLDYEVIWTNPIHGTYKGYDLYVNGEPDLGGPRLIESLNIAEEVKLSEMGNYSESPLALATIYQILSATLYSSNLPSYYGDSLDLTINSRIKKETSKQVWKIWKDKNNLNILPIQNKNDHTAAIVAVDRFGNVAVLIHSIIANNWGSTGIFIDGISIPDPACFQQALIEKVGPGKRLPTETVPGLIMKNEKPVLGFACIGGGAINQTFISLLNILDFNMTPQESVEKPGIGDFLFTKDKLCLTLEPMKFNDSLVYQAEKYNANFYETGSVMSVFWTGLYINTETGKLEGTKVWLK